MYGLTARFEVDDAKTPHTQVYLAVGVEAVLVGATVENGVRHHLQKIIVGPSGESADTAHF